MFSFGRVIDDILAAFKDMELPKMPSTDSIIKEVVDTINSTIDLKFTVACNTHFPRALRQVTGAVERLRRDSVVTTVQNNSLTGNDADSRNNFPAVEVQDYALDI